VIVRNRLCILFRGCMLLTNVIINLTAIMDVASLFFFFFQTQCFRNWISLHRQMKRRHKRFLLRCAPLEQASLNINFIENVVLQYCFLLYNVLSGTGLRRNIFITNVHSVRAWFSAGKCFHKTHEFEVLTLVKMLMLVFWL
jgi:hypothetical protein